MKNSIYAIKSWMLVFQTAINNSQQIKGQIMYLEEVVGILAFIG
ncbi:hypothetical protein [Leptospira ainazelensis]|nr:hypothetical protein [Leptospira ainazelensis]